MVAAFNHTNNKQQQQQQYTMVATINHTNNSLAHNTEVVEVYGSYKQAS